MSRAFVKEADGDDFPLRRYTLPARGDSAYDSAAARALLEGARAGDTASAEQATGYVWGEPQLREPIERILAEARASGDERLEQLAERFLRKISKS